MSDQHGNPFVLPGLGQHSDLSGNPLRQQARAGLDRPGGLASSSPMAGSAHERRGPERRIAELRSVENWLRMNLSMLSSTIQAWKCSAPSSTRCAPRRQRPAWTWAPCATAARPRRWKWCWPETGAGQGQGGRAVRRRGQGRRQRSGSIPPATLPGGGSRPGRRAALCRHERTDAPRRSRRPRPGGTCCSNSSGQIAAATAATMPPPRRPRWNPKPMPAPTAKTALPSRPQRRASWPRRPPPAPSPPPARQRPRRSRPPSAGPMISSATRNGSGPLRFPTQQTLMLNVVILAADWASACSPIFPKCCTLAGKPMLAHVGQCARTAPARITVVVGHGADRVKQAFGGQEGLHFARAAAAAGHRPRRSKPCRCCSRATARTM